MESFEPTVQAAYARLAAVNPDAYGRTRNALEGAVTRLSPYLTHGFLSLREVFAEVDARQALSVQDKFVFELGWRAYYRHVWSHLGDRIHESLHAGLLPEDAYQSEIPADVLEARTGIAAIDLAVRALYETGYVHNHARMWLASYMVHLRKIHWHAGAQWMLGHLLDGDVASNHLSWQWVAGTGSTKPYLFNADNVAKFAPAHWHSPGTVIDTGYEALDKIARSASPVHSDTKAGDTGVGLQQPRRLVCPPDAAWCKPEGALAVGMDVWLNHPWSLCAVPQPVAADVVVIGVGFDESHVQTPWSERRWRFVTEGLRAQTPHLWWGGVLEIARAVQGARSVRWQPDPHVNEAMDKVQTLLQSGQGQPVVKPQPRRCLFDPVEAYCQSFAQWWRRTKLSL